MWVMVEVVDTPGIESAGTADKTMYLVSFAEQQLG